MERFKHFLHFLCRKKHRLKVVLLRSVNLVRQILNQHIGLDRIFECRMNDGIKCPAAIYFTA